MINDDDELARAIDRLDALLKSSADLDDPRIIALGDAIEEYETRTDILNRPLEMRPEVRKAADASWERNEAGYRALAAMEEAEKEYAKKTKEGQG